MNWALESEKAALPGPFESAPQETKKRLGFHEWQSKFRNDDSFASDFVIMVRQHRIKFRNLLNQFSVKSLAAPIAETCIKF